VAGADHVPALHVMLRYVFDTGAGSHIGTSRITLYADGTHQTDSAWLQQGPQSAAQHDLAPAA
jgi:hypothetical protein